MPHWEDRSLHSYYSLSHASLIPRHSLASLSFAAQEPRGWGPPPPATAGRPCVHTFCGFVLVPPLVSSHAAVAAGSPPVSRNRSNFGTFFAFLPAPLAWSPLFPAPWPLAKPFAALSAGKSPAAAAAPLVGCPAPLLLADCFVRLQPTNQLNVSLTIKASDNMPIRGSARSSWGFQLCKQVRSKHQAWHEDW